VPTEELLSLLNNPLPFSDESEKGLISCLLQDTNKLADCRVRLTVDDFYQRATSDVYAALLDMDEASHGIDVATLTRVLSDRGKLGSCGGAAYISELFTFIPATAHYELYIKAIRDKSILRKQIRESAESILDAFRFGAEYVDADVERHLQDCESRIRGVSGGVTTEDHESMGYWVDRTIDQIEDRMRRSQVTGEGVLPGSSTGIACIDERIHGLCDGEMIIIGGKPSDGKTALGLQIALFQAIKNGEPTDYTLMESSGVSLMTRAIAHVGGVPMQHLLRGKMERWMQDEMTKAIGLISKAPLTLNHRPGMTPPDLCARMRMMHRKHGTRKFFVDYLQRLRVDQSGGKVNGLTDASAMIADTTAELGVSTVVLAQLASDGTLADCKAPKRDVDGMITLGCPAKHGIKPRVNKDGEVNPEDLDQTKRYLYFAKARNGERGGKPYCLDFDGATGTFK